MVAHQVNNVPIPHTADPWVATFAPLTILIPLGYLACRGALVRANLDGVAVLLAVVAIPSVISALSLKSPLWSRIAFLPVMVGLFLPLGVSLTERVSEVPILDSRPCTFGGDAILNRDDVLRIERNPKARIASIAEIETLLLEYEPPQRPHTVDFTCKSFAAHLVKWSEDRGVRAGVAGMAFADGTTHAITCFPVADGGVFYVDDTPGRTIPHGILLREVSIAEGIECGVVRAIVRVAVDDAGNVVRSVGEAKPESSIEGKRVVKLRYF